MAPDSLLKLVRCQFKSICDIQHCIVANGMSLNVPVHVVNVKDYVKIATLMQAPVIQVMRTRSSNYIIGSE